jgi:hypothetical protein
MQIAILGIDLGKNSGSVVGLNNSGHVVVRRRDGLTVHRRFGILI